MATEFAPKRTHNIAAITDAMVESSWLFFSTHELRLAVELADSIYVIGYPQGTTDYATIVRSFDLKKLGLAWTKYGQAHIDLVKEIDNTMMNSW